MVPVGTKEGEVGNYVAIRSSSDVTLQAPAAPGLYEIRYLLNVDKRTVASLPLEAIDPQVVLQVPGTALQGGEFDISWAGAVNPRDYVTIVPVGTDEGVHGNYITARDDATGAQRVPAETGMYEVRYVLREGNKTLAAEMIEITGPVVSVSGPETAITGSRIDVSWTGAVSDNDDVTIVPVGTDEGECGNYVVVRDKESARLNIPAETGIYELR